MLSVEQIIICILVVIIIYLYYLYKKALSANKKEEYSTFYSNTKRTTSLAETEAGTPPQILEEEEEEEEPEYTYDDPNFKLSPILPHQKMSGTIIGEFGDAIYGDDKRYYKDVYYGRVSYKAKIELLDKRVYKNQFELNIIKIRVIKNEWKSEEGLIGWVGLMDTSFREKFDPESRTIKE